MKEYLTIIIFTIALISCEKNEFIPIENNNTVIDLDACLDTCGTIMSCKYDTQNYPIITSVLTVKTTCDTLDVVKIHTLEQIQYFTGMDVCFTR